MPGSLEQVGEVVPYLLIPVAATVVGGLAAALKPPNSKVTSGIQHFAAGVVFAAVAGELLPDIMHRREPVPAVLGFIAGVLLMLAVKSLSQRVTSGGSEQPARTEAEGSLSTESKAKRNPSGLVVTVGIDVLVDGLLVGVGFAAGAKQGVLLTIALSIEVLFLSLSAVAALAAAGVSRARVVGLTFGMAGLLSVGALVGVFLLAGLSGALLEAVLSFGAAALLYLVTEELLVEAHEVPETPLLASMFFVGFLVLFVIEMVA